MGETLYERLGETEGIEAVVDEFYDRVLADETLQEYFEDTDTDALREHQRAFLTMVTGGPEDYDGDDMRKAHAELGINEGDFVAVASHLDTALEEKDVEKEDRQAVLSEVAGLKDAVIKPQCNQVLRQEEHTEELEP